METMRQSVRRIDRCPAGTGSFQPKQQLAILIDSLQIPACRLPAPRTLMPTVKPAERLEGSRLLAEF
jgi:hypothetical protein